MSKISSVLLFCCLIWGMMCIEPQGKQNFEKETSGQSFNNQEVQKVKPIRKSLIIEDDAEEVSHQQEQSSFKASPSESFQTQRLSEKQKFSIISKGNRLLSDDYNDQNTNSNDYQDDHDGDDSSNNKNSNCAQERCQSCVNNSCTQCKLGQNGQEKYLLINGRCYESDNHTNDDRHEVDSKEKWDDHQNYHEQGQVSYGGRKYKCQVGCKVCNSSADITKCTTCMDGFALNSTIFKCMRCDDKCVTCSSDNLGNCTACYPGWTLDGPDASGMFTCSKCSTDHCGQCDTVDNCTKCKNFYFRQSETTCESCLSNCRTCQNSSSCQECFSGYFLTQLDGAQSCVLCASGCASCSSLTDCVKCYPGYLMNSNTKVCEKCSSNCWECVSSTVCSRCVMGYQLLNNACVSYIEDCAVMNTDNTCKQCFEGYLLSDSNTRCAENEAHDDHVCGENQYLLNRVCTNCGVTVENCQKCNNETCLKCKPEYFREANGTTCTLCRNAMAGCKKCDNSIFCSRCADGYFMEQDRNGSVVLSYGKCIKCDENCLTCNEKGIYCTSCNTGYSLSTARTCVPSNQFDFTLLLNLDLNEFPSKIAQFKSDLAKLIKDDSVSQSEKEKFVQIVKIASGSIMVQGTFAASSQSALQNTKSTFDTTLATGSTFGGIQVLSSNSQQRDNEDDHDDDGDDDDNDNESSSNTGMIVGIVVGVICAVIVIIAILVYCCCCKKTVEESDEANMDDKKSRSTVDDLVATQMIQQSYENNQIHVNSNPEGPQYFV